MALPRPREDRWRYLGALLSPTPCSPLLPSRGQSAVEFLLEGSRILGCPKRTPSTARPLSRGPWALIGLPFSVWTGACYWHGVGGSMFNSSSPARRLRAKRGTNPELKGQSSVSKNLLFQVERLRRRKRLDVQGVVWKRGPSSFLLP